MDALLTKDQLSFQHYCKDFAQREILPYQRKIEDDLDFRKKLYQKMAKEGFFSLTIPKQLGGHFTSTLNYILALMALAKADAGITVGMSVTTMVAQALLHYGSQEQQERYLPRINSGDYCPSAFAITEKEAGSDVKMIQTSAKQEGDGSYLINGEKRLISNADLAGITLIFAKTDASQSHGITAFIVERGTPGFSIAKKEEKLGLLSANLVTIKLDNCRVAAKQILGNLNEGFKIAMTSLDSGRLAIAAQAVGIAEAAYEAALDYAKERRQFDQPLADLEVIRFKLADMHVKLSAAKALLFKACHLKDQGIRCSLEVSEAKLYCTEISNEIASEALQIHGGYGYIKDYPVERYFRDARATTIYEGTSEIQRLIIAKQILQ